MSHPLVSMTVQNSSYSDSLSYLMEELQLLELKLRLAFERNAKKRHSETSKQFYGLVLFEEDIAHLIGINSEPPPKDLEIHALEEHIKLFEETIFYRRSESIKGGIFLSLDHLSNVFHLTPIEEKCLIMALAIEIDSKYEKIYAYIQDDLNKKYPTLELVLKLYVQNDGDLLSIRNSFLPDAPLHSLVQNAYNDNFDTVIPLISRPFKLVDSIADFLLGTENLDYRIQSFARLISPSLQSESDRLYRGYSEEMGLARAIAEASPNGAGCVIYVYGSYVSGRRHFIETICCFLGLDVLYVDLALHSHASIACSKMIGMVERDALLYQAIPCFENIEDASDEVLKHGMNRVANLASQNFPVIFITGCKRWEGRPYFSNVVYLEKEVLIPSNECLIDHWLDCTSQFDLEDGVEFGQLTNKFKLDPDQITMTLKTAQRIARSNSDNTAHKITTRDLYQACRMQTTYKIAGLAHLIKSEYEWDDIVLPDDQMQQLKEVCARVDFSHIVHDQWRFARLAGGIGINVLFCGPPGTGKTMAAGIIAGELGLELIKIDLSMVVSKYVGETEKNLQNIFNAAESSNAVLFFDEADALFGKRSEVKDSHDRYANIEIAYLLQKMEEYQGITILATNLKGNLDQAFARRMHHIIDFPLPDQQLRRKIWELMLSGPAPTIELDFEALSRVNLSGGSIRNIVINAAFMAAEAGNSIDMPTVMLAVKREYQKTGTAITRSDFGMYYDLVIR